MNTVFFDFDGTLIDTWPGIEKTLRGSFQALALPVRDEEITTELVGVPLLKVFERLLGADSEMAEAAVQKYRDLFPETGISGSRPFEGAVGMLEELKRRKTDLFLVTARNEAITKQMMAEHGLNGFFTWVRGEREGEALDSKTGMMAEVLQRYNVPPGSCVMVGDRRYDMEAALANNIGAIGVTYGYGTREELLEAGAGQLAGSVGELRDILFHKNR